jgi:hypothetical protein
MGRCHEDPCACGFSAIEIGVQPEAQVDIEATRSPGKHHGRVTAREALMWWAIGFGGLLYLILALTLGFMTIRNGHGWMFFFGLFFPLLWIFGAFMGPTDRPAAV